MSSSSKRGVPDLGVEDRRETDDTDSTQTTYSDFAANVCEQIDTTTGLSDIVARIATTREAHIYTRSRNAISSQLDFRSGLKALAHSAAQLRSFEDAVGVDSGDVSQSRYSDTTAPEHQDRPIAALASATSGALARARCGVRLMPGRGQYPSSNQASITGSSAIDSTSTTELLRIAASGDPAAWEAIVRRFEPALAAMITTYRLQEADARDAAQRTWLRMLENHQQIREPEALGGWLRTTARRECLRILAEQRPIEPLAERAEYLDAGVDVERLVVEADEARRLRGLLATLPRRSITLITSLFQDDPPNIVQLSASTGIPVGSIGPTRARALHKLRRIIEETDSTWLTG